MMVGNEEGLGMVNVTDEQLRSIIAQLEAGHRTVDIGRRYGRSGAWVSKALATKGYIYDRKARKVVRRVDRYGSGQAPASEGDGIVAEQEATPAEQAEAERVKSQLERDVDEALDMLAKAAKQYDADQETIRKMSQEIVGLSTELSRIKADNKRLYEQMAIVDSQCAKLKEKLYEATSGRLLRQGIDDLKSRLGG
jgi:chromosome segregation ATPase